MPIGIGDYCINIPTRRNGVPLSLIPAGNTESFDYWKKLSSINWYELIYENENGLAFFLHLKESIKRDINPDFLLIDSRTGISEMSGITLSLLAEEVVVVAANNRENLGGARKIIRSLANPDNSLFGEMPKITFVLSRIPFTDRPGDKARELLLINRIKREYLFPIVSEINVIHSDRELEENEQVKIAYDKDESIAQSSRDYLSLFERLTENDLTEIEIKRFKDIRQSELLFYRASTENIPLEQKLELVSRAILLNDVHINLYIFRANIYLALKDYERALSDANHALKINDLYIQAHHVGIVVLYESKKYNEALERINGLLRIDPTSYFALCYKGIIYTNLGRLKDAEMAFSEVIEQNPDSALGYAGRANVFRLAGLFDNALLDVYKALEIDSELVDAVGTLAEILAAQGNLGGFYVHLENALKIDPKYMEKAINEEFIYKNFFNQERFLMLLTKYNIVLEDRSPLQPK